MLYGAKQTTCPHGADTRNAQPVRTSFSKTHYLTKKADLLGIGSGITTYVGVYTCLPSATINQKSARRIIINLASSRAICMHVCINELQRYEN